MYDEPRLRGTRQLATECPRCGGPLSEEPQPALIRTGTALVFFCTDESGCGWREWRPAERAQAIAELASAGHTIEEIAAEVGVSRRTVFRELRQLRESEVASR